MKLVAILVLSLVIVILGIRRFKKCRLTTIYIENHSSSFIDSAFVYIDGHKCFMGAIPPGTTSSLKILPDTIEPARITTIFPKIYISDSLIGDIGSVSDLGWGYMKSYRFVLNRNLTIQEVNR